MDKIVLVIVLTLFLLVFLFYLRKKKMILEYLSSIYGVPTSRVYDERDFMQMSQLFTLNPLAGKETIDTITWNDLQMALLFKEMNYSISDIGDAYFYRHLRTQQHDDLDRLQSHIEYFDTHPEHRLKLQYAFFKVRFEAKDSRYARRFITSSIKPNYVSNITDMSKFPTISIFPSIIILLCAILSCILLYNDFSNNSLNDNSTSLGALAFTFVFIGALAYFIFFARKVGAYISTLQMFSSSISTCKSISMLDSPIFDKELKELQPAIKKLRKKTLLMDFLVSVSMLQNKSAVGAFLGLTSIYFGLYGFVFIWVSKVLKKHQKDALFFYESIGYFELCIAQASYRKTLSYYCTPTYGDDTQISFTEIYHPLLKNPITNSKTIDCKFILTGANASGKSTFAKMIAINAITAQSLHLCFAKRFVFKPAMIYTSMRIEDDITAGNSFYIAEIKRLKTFLNKLASKQYYMFFADEILKGTNTIERIGAASAILEVFGKGNCFFCLTTHDTELTTTLQNYYTKYHFKEITTDTMIRYDYKLYDGVAPSSNAIALLRFSTFDTSIIREATTLVEGYKLSGEWKTLA